MARQVQEDTVVIEIDEKNRIVIHTEDKESLKKLREYDINKMIRNLVESIKDDDVRYYEISEDEDRYRDDDIRDTTIIYQDARDKRRTYERDWDDWDKDWNDDWDRNTRKNYTDKRKVRRTSNDFNLELGTNNWLENGRDFPNDNDELYSVRPWGSWYVGLNSTNTTWIGGPLNLNWGFGVSWYNWKFEDDDVLAVHTDTGVDFVPVDSTLNPIKSKLTASYVNFTMVPMLDFSNGPRRVNDRFWRSKRGEGFRIGAGGYVGYRIASHSKLVYKESGGRERDKERDNFYLNNLRYGVRAQMGFKDLDVFVNYDLNEVFTAGNGPSLNAISFGVIF